MRKKKTYTVREAAAWLGLSYSAVGLAIKLGQLKATRVSMPSRGGTGYVLLIDGEELERYAASRRPRKPAAPVIEPPLPKPGFILPLPQDMTDRQRMIVARGFCATMTALIEDGKGL